MYLYYLKYANKIYKSNNAFFIGRQIDYGLCEEGSLKLKEISYINSSAFASGELKHGTISLIENKTPVISIITDEDISLKTISNIKEVHTRGAYSLFITTLETFTPSKSSISSKLILLKNLINLSSIINHP